MHFFTLAKTPLSIFLKLFIVLCIFSSVAMLPVYLLDSGLDKPEKIGKYLNGNLPSSAPVAEDNPWILAPAFPKLSFRKPICIKPEPKTNRLFVADKDGLIEVFDNNPSVNKKSTFLDIRKKTFRSGESGLNEFAFHPDYREGKNFIYVFYKWRPSSAPVLNSKSKDNPANLSYYRVSRFTVRSNFSSVDPNSELVLIQQYDRATNHNGGSMFFGEDGFLYIFVGDEGGGGDTYDVSQKINDRLFSGVLRIDVDNDKNKSNPIKRQPKQTVYQPSNWPKSLTRNYGIPKSNPWVSSGSSVLGEFYALGLRNPHKASYDPISQKVWIGDVGQNKQEEINHLVKKGNYQWVYKEGTANYSNRKKPTNLIGSEVPPIYSYSHGSGNNCIIGGYVYTGSEFPSLKGKYIFADNGSGRIWSLKYTKGRAPERSLLLDTEGSGYRGISSFGIDGKGNMYVMKLSGSGDIGIYKLSRELGRESEAPQWLSETGAFSNLSRLTPTKGLIPYQPKISFWSDGAVKQRWVAIPNNGTHNSTVERILYSENDYWDFPIGTVFIKHMELPLIQGEENGAKRRVETRFLVKGEDGSFFGFTYRWLPDGSDAQLLEGSYEEKITVKDKSGKSYSQIWTFPSRDQCLNCHTEGAGRVLGMNSRQLNHNFTYPTTGKKANQISTFKQLGIFRNPPSDKEIADLPTLAAIDDKDANIETKARSYLDVNCAYCHRPETGVRANFDARFSVPLEDQQIINGTLEDNRGDEDAKVVVPGKPERSFLLTRMDRVNEGLAMPPIAKNEIDLEGVALIRSWISGMAPEPDCKEKDCDSSPTYESDPIGETGTLRLDHNWSKIPVKRSYSNPVIILGVPSFQGSHEITSRVVINNNNDFRARIDEWKCLDGSHTKEQVSYMVIEAGTYKLENGATLIAGVANNVNHNWKQVNFPSAFEKTPLLFVQRTKSDGGYAATVRVNHSRTNRNGFQMRIQESKIQDDKHYNENVSWIAVEESISNSENSFEVKGTGKKINSSWATINFIQSYSKDAPLFATIQSVYEADPVTIRYDANSFSSKRVKVFLEEENCIKDGKNHANEEVAYWIFDKSGLIFSRSITAHQNVPQHSVRVANPENSLSGFKTQISIYPNPALDYANIQIDLDMEFTSFELIDIAGRVIKEDIIKNGSYQLEFRGLQEGIYFMKFNLDGEYVVKKIVKSK